MAITTATKAKLVKEYQRSEKDTGAPEVQVALLTADITYLTEHFKIHKKDNHSRQGLLRKVNERRSLLKYLKRIDLSRYQDLISRLGIRGIRN